MTNIVVVEDQPVMASIYRAKFLAEGFHVEVATDGEQALELIQRTRPSLVLLDMMLPKIKGMDVLKTLRANESFKLMPIVVFSNASQPGVVEAAWDAGATMVLSKMNTSPKHMVESVLSALAKSSAARTELVESAMASGATTLADGECPRVLLVESNKETRALVGHLLAVAGCQVINAEGQEHAALLSEITDLNLVLVNSSLCRIGPRSFCEQLRRKVPELPIVAYAMNSGIADITEAATHGVSRFLTTPDQLLNIGQIAASLIGMAQAPQLAA